VTRPEEALEKARAAAAQARADGGYLDDLQGLQVEPTDAVTIDRLLEWARTVLTWVNPIAPFINGLRTVVYDGNVPSTGTMAYIAIAAVVSAGIGTALFRRLQSELAVVV
jgi:hypothetical protein